MIKFRWSHDSHHASGQMPDLSHMGYIRPSKSFDPINPFLSSYHHHPQLLYWTCHDLWLCFERIIHRIDHTRLTLNAYCFPRPILGVSQPARRPNSSSVSPPTLGICMYMRSICAYTDCIVVSAPSPSLPISVWLPDTTNRVRTHALLLPLCHPVCYYLI